MSPMFDLAKQATYYHYTDFWLHLSWNNKNVNTKLFNYQSDRKSQLNNCLIFIENNV